MTSTRPASEPPGTPPAGEDRPGTLRTLRTVIVLALLVPLVLYLAAIVYLRGQAMTEARARADSAARIGEEHALKVFETNMALLARIRDLLGDDDDASLRAREGMLHERLQRMSEGLSQLQGIWLIGSDGRLIAGNRVFPTPQSLEFLDRPYFSHHRDGGTQPYFTEVLTSRSTGEPFFDVSLRRTHLDGRFAGVINVSLTPHYFRGFYRELAGGDRNLHIELLRDDGTVIAGWPREPQPGDVAGKSPLQSVVIDDAVRPASLETLPDGREALIASRRLVGYPLRVNVWMDREAVLAEWKPQAAMLGALMLAIAGGLAGLAWLALQRTQRALEVAAALREETAQRARAEAALQQAQKLEALGRLTGGVAHDFNNLLTVIGNNAYLHKRMSPGAAGSAQLAAIERAVAAGGKLTGRLLSFSRRRSVRSERVELQQRLPTIVELLVPTLGGRIDFQVSIDPGTAQVEVDPSELELALLNLALNSKDAMPEGGRLQLNVTNAVPGTLPGLDGPAVVISLHDTGQGIEPALLERVFEPFFTTKPMGQGTGLGLSQVYGFCQRANGRATVESRPGEGTTVTMILPAVPPARIGASRHTPAASDISGTRIVLVDDDHEVADATRGVLESLGCIVTRIQDAGEALDRIDELVTRTDIVVSDIRMPGPIDGIELGTHLRSRHPALPVLLMSGFADSIEQATRAGLTVLQKPCPPDRLATAIRRALDHHGAGAVPAGSPLG